MEDLRERDLGEFEAAILALPPLMLALLCGDLSSAWTEFSRIAPLEGSDDPWDRTLYCTYLILIASAEERRHEDALERGLELLDSSAELLGGTAYTPDWDAWPSMLSSALALGDLEAAHGLISRFADRPSGHMPPYWRAQLSRGQGLVAAAEADLDAAEAYLRTAALQFAQTGSVYWSAVTDVDLAEVLIRQGHGDEAGSLLSDATAFFERFGAAPVLARSRELTVRLVPDPLQLAASSKALS